MLRLNSARSAGGSCFFRNSILLANVIYPSKQFSGPDPRHGLGERHRAEYDRHDRCGSVHHHAAGPGRDGRSAGAAGMGFGSVAGGVRRTGFRRTGGSAAGFGRIVSLPARNLWAADLGAADLVSVYLAGIVQRTVVDCDRMHRPSRVRRLLLARTGDGVRAS